MHIPQWILVAYPWTQDAVAWGTFFHDLWKAIDDVVILLGMLWVVRRLRYERVRFRGIVEDLNSKVETYGQMAKAAQDAAEESVAATAGDAGASISNWEFVRTEWRTVRDRIEWAVENIPNKNVRNKYSKFPRYGYREVINSLRNDRQITPQVEIALLSMNQLFMRSRPHPSRVSPADVSDFKSWLQIVNGSLPRKPEQGVLPLDDQHQEQRIGEPNPNPI